MTIYNLHFCSFCRKVPEETKVAMIAGPEGINICDKCVDLCTEIIAEHRKKLENQKLNQTDAG